MSKTNFLRNVMLAFLVLLIPALAQAQSSIRGVVTDNYGEPLIGAAVQVAGTSQYAITDNDGAFSISNVAFPARITVSFMGMTDKVLNLTGSERMPLSIVMESDNVLEELVVVGYGTQKRVNLTGAVSVIDGKELNARPVTNTAMALQGADPSLVLTTSSGSIDGTNYSVNIRGKLSLNSGSPLILALAQQRFPAHPCGWHREFPYPGEPQRHREHFRAPGCVGLRHLRRQGVGGCDSHHDQERKRGDGQSDL